jgi:4'-phosphopantetheinyl transferase
MPLIFEKKLDGACLGVWHIVETEDLLRKFCRAVPEDIIIVDSYKNESRRKQWFACRLLLGQLLHLDRVKVCYNEHGKPSLEGFGGEISISHTRDYAAVLINENGAAGIDIEKISPRIERIADRFLQEGELVLIGKYRETRHEPSEDCNNREGEGLPVQGNPHTELLYIHWCSKEALYKFYGKPSVDLKNDIYIIPFDYFCNSQATFQARVVIEESVEIHDLEFERIEDHVLVYTLAKSK